MSDHHKKLPDGTTPAALFLLVLFQVILNRFGVDAHLPSLPVIVHHFHVPRSMGQSTVTLYLLGFSLSQLVFGPMSDRWGRRPLMLIGNSVFLVGTLGCVFAPSASFLLWARLLQGCGMGCGGALFRTIMRDCFEGRRLVQFSSYMVSASGVMPIVAPVLGGYIQQHMGWRYTFAFLLLYTVIFLSVLTFKFPETLRTLQHDLTIKKTFQAYKHIFSHRIFVLYMLCSGLGAAGVLAYATESPFLFQEGMGLSPVHYGWLGVIIAAGLMFGGMLNAQLIKRWQTPQIMRMAALIWFLAGSLMFGFSEAGYFTVPVVMLPMWLYLVGCGCIWGNAYVGAFEAIHHNLGAAGAVFGAFQLLMGASSAALVTVLHDTTQFILSIVLISLSVLLAMLLFFIHKVSAKPA